MPTSAGVPTPRRGHPAVGRGILQSRWTVAGGRRMHALVSATPVTADRVPVVLVHGLVLSSRFVAPLAERLAPHFRVHAPDLPGFGRSEAPGRVLDVAGLADALAEWMEATGIERAALAGHSLGCQVIAALAARSPERVARAVLIAPTTDPRARSAPRQLVRLLADGVREKPSLALLHLRDYARVSPRRALGTFRHMLDDRIEERLRLLRAPTLVVRGGRDPVVSQRWAEEATRLLPEGRLRVIPGATHAAHWDAPLEVARVVRPFLLEGSHGTGPARGERPGAPRPPVTPPGSA